MECVCGTSFTVEHAFTCPHGGYPSLCHNEIRDTTAQLISEVYPNVATEPTLQPVMNECFFHHFANTESDACLDVRAQRFWGLYHQQAYIFLMSMCLTPWLHLIVIPPSLLTLDPMTVRNVEHMHNRSVRWKEDLLPPYIFSTWWCM